MLYILKFIANLYSRYYFKLEKKLTLLIIYQVQHISIEAKERIILKTIRRFIRKLGLTNQKFINYIKNFCLKVKNRHIKSNLNITIIVI